MEKKHFDSAFKDPFDLEPRELKDEPWKTIAAELLQEDESDRQEKMARFLEIYRADPQIAKWRVPEDGDKWEKDEHLIKFLRAGSWDTQTALTILQTYLNSGKLYTGIVRVAIPKQLEHVWEKKLSAVTEYRDHYGRRIFIYRPGSWNPDEVHVNELLASSYVMFELMAEEIKTQIAGVTCVVDLYGFGFKQLRNFGIEQVKCMTSFMSGAFPLWVRKIHVVNNPRLFSVLHNMMKPFLDERVKDNMVFHGSDYTELHKEVPVSILPDTMGGPGELDNKVSINLLRERNQHYIDIVEKTLKHST